MQKALAAVFLLLMLATLVSADLADIFDNAAGFLKGNQITGFVTASPSIMASGSSVARAGKWDQSGTGENSALITSQLGSTLTFSFTGTSIGVIAYRNDGIKSTLTIDGTAYDIDTSRMTSSNCWNSNNDYCEIPLASGLSNSQHSAVLRTASGTGSFHVHRFIINTGTAAAPSTTSCNDVDGQNFYMKSSVTSSAYQNEGGSRTDLCSGEKTVIEQICAGNTPSSISYECLTGCSDGACTQAGSCSAYTIKYKDGKLSTDGTGVEGYNTLTYGPVCKNGEYYWCTIASQNANCYGCYTGNLCSAGTQCQASPYFDHNSDGIIDDTDESMCNECIGKYSGTCTRCDFNGDCAITLSDVEAVRAKKTKGCDSLKNTRYTDGVRTGNGVEGYDKLTYGPVCRNNVKYWCTQSSENANCFGCYYGNACTDTQKPDLSVEEIRLSEPVTNKDLDLAVVFKNRGSAATRIFDYEISAGVNVAVFSSTFDGDLIPGESATVYAKVRYGTEGTSKITAKIDKGNRVEELDESNNELAKEFAVAAALQKEESGGQECTKLHITCGAAASDSITASLNPVTGARSYILEWRKTGTEKWTGCNNVNECGSTRNPGTEIQAIGLDTYTTYQLRARIESGTCSGTNSDIIFCSTKEKSGCSSRLQAGCEAAGNDAIKVIVQPESGTSSYLVEWRKSGTEKWRGCSSVKDCGQTRSQETTINAIGLEASTAYQIRARVAEGTCTGIVSEMMTCETGERARLSRSGPPIPPGSSLPELECQAGLRTGTDYCADGNWERQKQEGAACQNDFECSTNSCLTGKCVDLEKQLKEQRSLLERILRFFRLG